MKKLVAALVALGDENQTSGNAYLVRYLRN